MDGSIGFSTSLSVQFYLFVHLSTKINLIKIFEHRVSFLLKKSKFMNLLQKKLQLNRYIKIEFNTPFNPLQNEPSPILVGTKLGEQLSFECQNTSLFRRAVVAEN